VAEFTVSVLVCENGVVEVLLLVGESKVSRLLSADRGWPMLLCEAEAGELCAERYKLPAEGRVRIVGSARLAIAFVVLSRANAANVKRPERFCFVEFVDNVDWRFL
jgi:hypothetical protein